MITVRYHCSTCRRWKEAQIASIEEQWTCQCGKQSKLILAFSASSYGKQFGGESFVVEPNNFSVEGCNSQPGAYVLVQHSPKLLDSSWACCAAGHCGTDKCGCAHEKGELQ